MWNKSLRVEMLAQKARAFMDRYCRYAFQRVHANLHFRQHRTMYIELEKKNPKPCGFSSKDLIYSMSGILGFSPFDNTLTNTWVDTPLCLSLHISLG